ncbi:hypothetical protein [Rhizobium ruizarguesonis]|uniref:hypothetical protein n=1 Tax=Rhizobium ruizarguesonis TaxID=2081791 RepID=UPI00103111CE|nr:hypothetical protein [Rhizobium ruizarguesonis]TBD19410.1 hypothetical protein ELH20_27480 [Rhizobium ruizarguesonis]TBD35038.1 hypothetical protein ELH17_29450 [Rhizobium ruizarguesonis]TBD56140.1 hypothetical protein ELH16_30535 [Rhizobium ruizarguesonis]TBF02933.1 hypothetical protein ELG96_28965 [Rhizobium ruizarguesonis]
MQIIFALLILVAFAAPALPQDGDDEYCNDTIGYRKDREEISLVIMAHDGNQQFALDPFEKCVALGDEVIAMQKRLEIDARCSEAMAISDRGLLSATMSMQTTYCDPSELQQ